jgi:hypothetical protein
MNPLSCSCRRLRLGDCCSPDIATRSHSSGAALTSLKCSSSLACWSCSSSSTARLMWHDQAHGIIHSQCSHRWLKLKTDGINPVSSAIVYRIFPSVSVISGLTETGPKTGRSKTGAGPKTVEHFSVRVYGISFLTIK